ncbi:hypothetical protein, partial [Staphylococcus aureus]|uniref:hypothetical protein n=1 Tax=Staphylococcus aureus TaxID=1280 RepID=UPI00193B58F8
NYIYFNIVTLLNNALDLGISDYFKFSTIKNHHLLNLSYLLSDIHLYQYDIFIIQYICLMIN